VNTKEIPFGQITENKIYLHAWGDHPQREIGEVKDGNEDASIQYFVLRYEELDGKITEIETRIEQAENKGSFLMKLLHLKESLASHDGLGDYQALALRLDNQISLLQEIVEKNRLKNSEIKKELLEEVKQAVEMVNWKEATEKITDIRLRWIKTGNATDDENQALEEEFWPYINQFYERKKSFYEDKIRLAAHFEKKYREIIEEAREAKSLFGFKQKEFIQSLKNRWKENGSVLPEIYLPLQEEFTRVLKEVVKKPEPGQRLKDIAWKVDKFITNHQRPNIHELKALQGELKKMFLKRPDEKQLRYKINGHLMQLIELDFVEKICFKKFRDYPKKSDSEKAECKTIVIQDLLDRDKAELTLFEQNLEKFKSYDPKVNQMMDKKLNYQRQKIELKEKLLRELSR